MLTVGTTERSSDQVLYFAVGVGATGSLPESLDESFRATFQGCVKVIDTQPCAPLEPPRRQ